MIFIDSLYNAWEINTIMFVRSLMFFCILASVSNWNEVREVLYPGWKECVNSDGISALEPPETNIEKQDNDDVLFVLLPNEDNMNQFQPKVWLWDAYEQNKLDVMRFLLMNGSKLPSPSPMYYDAESRLALELNNQCREEYVALFLLYEPIDLEIKLKILAPYIISCKLDIIQVMLSLSELLHERMINRKSFLPEYESPAFFNELTY